MITLTDAEYEQLERLSFTLGASKSRVISHALKMMENELKQANFGAFQHQTEEKTDNSGGENAIY